MIFRTRTTLILLLAVFSGCSQVTNAIDSFFTFNDTRSFDLPFPAASPVGILIPAEVPIAIDSATLAKNHTGISLVKTATLTKLTITFSDPTYIMQTGFDTLYLQITNPTLGAIDLASYSRSADVMNYTNSNFADFVKDTGSHFIVTTKLLAAPKTDIVAHTEVVITYTAKPL